MLSPIRTKADLHTHTSFSDDCRTSPEALVFAARQAGLGVLGVTDHDSVKGGLACQRLAGDGMVVLVGQEIDTADGDVIVFGLHDSLPPHQPAEDTVAIAKKRGGFVMIPHPFERRRSHIAPKLDRLPVDLLETFNSHTASASANTQAVLYAQRRQLPAVASTDAHTPSEIGSTYTILDTSRPIRTEADAYAALTSAPRTFHTHGGTFSSFVRRKLGL